MKRPENLIGRTIPFTRIPDAILDAEWTPLLWGRWRDADHITLGEGRTVIKLLELLAKEPRCHRRRLLSLQDNRPVSGSFAKGRSTAPPLNHLCRQKASFSLAAELQLLLPWVQTSRMPADELSRKVGDDAAKVECVSQSQQAVPAVRRRPQG